MNEPLNLQDSLSGITLTRVLKGVPEQVNRVTWSPNGQLLAFGDDETVYLWDPNGGLPPKTVKIRSDFVFGVDWSRDGETLALASTNGAVLLYNLLSEEVSFSIAHGHWIYGVAWSMSSNLLASSSVDGKIFVSNTETGVKKHYLIGHRAGVYCVSWSPTSPILASCSADRTIGLWNLNTKSQVIRSPQLLVGHSDEVNSIAWSPNGRLLASGSEDNTVRIWDVDKGYQTNVLEGHLNGVTSVSFSFDGSILASKSIDNTVRLWRCDGWESLGRFAEPSTEENSFAGLAFHPRKLILATLGESNKTVRIWNLEKPKLFGKSRPKNTIHYMSAKVVLVGESNVGKSCLALRLAENRYEEQGTTHGMRFWPIAPERLDSKAVLPKGEKRDVILWDMGGQDEYRLVHQLFLHDMTLALVLLDPSRGRTAFEEVVGWNKRLDQQLQGRRAVKILIGTKLDEESGIIDHSSIDRLVTDCEFAGYHAISAKTGKGVSELRTAISNNLDWNTLAKTSRPRLFQHIREAIEDQKKKDKVVLAYSDLEKLVRRSDPDEFDIEALNAVVKQLALQGLIADTQLASRERVLVLKIGEIERYAGAVIIAARNNPRNVPAIEGRKIPLPDMSFPGIKDSERLPRDQELVILQCVIQLLLQHGICLEHEGLLIFPALFQPTEREREESFSHSVSLYYDFSGAIDNIYSSLTAWLAISQQFGRMRLWEHRAEFEQAGQGACGLRRVNRGSGFAHLDVYFNDHASKETRDLFVSFIEDHLLQHGVDIYERLEITCACGFSFAEESTRRRVAEGFTDIGCPDCDRRTTISEGARKARERDPDLERKTWALRTKIEKRAKQIVLEAKNLFERANVEGPVSELIRILHLSDLHMNANTDPMQCYNRLLPI